MRRDRASGRPASARLDNNRFFVEHVQSAVDRELGARGFERTTGTPDVLVHIHAHVE